MDRRQKKLLWNPLHQKAANLRTKRILFVTYEPDKEEISVYQMPQEEVLKAEIKEKKANE